MTIDHHNWHSHSWDKLSINWFLGMMQSRRSPACLRTSRRKPRVVSVPPKGISFESSRSDQDSFHQDSCHQKKFPLNRPTDQDSFHQGSCHQKEIPLSSLPQAVLLCSSHVSSGQEENAEYSVPPKGTSFNLPTQDSCHQQGITFVSLSTKKRNFLYLHMCTGNPLFWFAKGF